MLRLRKTKASFLNHENSDNRRLPDRPDSRAPVEVRIDQVARVAGEPERVGQARRDPFAAEMKVERRRPAENFLVRALRGGPAELCLCAGVVYLFPPRN
mgnify:CR=1 FL=1